MNCSLLCWPFVACSIDVAHHFQLFFAVHRLIPNPVKKPQYPSGMMRKRILSLRSLMMESKALGSSWWRVRQLLAQWTERSTAAPRVLWGEGTGGGTLCSRFSLFLSVSNMCPSHCTFQRGHIYTTINTLFIWTFYSSDIAHSSIIGAHQVFLQSIPQVILYPRWRFTATPRENYDDGQAIRMMRKVNSLTIDFNYCQI